MTGGGDHPALAGVRVGTVGFPGGRGRVLDTVTAVEIAEGRGLPPRRAAGRKLRAAVPDEVELSAALSRHLVEPLPAGTPVPGDPAAYGGLATTAENLGLFRRCVDYAAALRARYLVLPTPASFTPSPANRERLGRFLDAADAEVEPPVPIVWEPRGPWEHDAAADLARELGLLLAVDPLRDDPPDARAAYLRLGPFAALGSQLGVYDLERIAETALSFDETWCVFETTRALEDARNLRAVLIELAALLDDEEPDADEL